MQTSPESQPTDAGAGLTAAGEDELADAEAGKPPHEQRDPHSPEGAANIVVDELMADRGTSEKVAEEAEEAARQVEAEEDAD